MVENTVPDIYVNGVGISVSLYDVTLSFKLSTIGDDGTLIMGEVVRIRMSPQHALSLSILLDQNLKVYGDTYKEIFLPDELIKRLRGNKESKGDDKVDIK